MDANNILIIILKSMEPEYFSAFLYGDVRFFQEDIVEYMILVTVLYFWAAHNTLCLPPKFCINYYL